MKTNKIIDRKDWIVLYFNKKNKQIGSGPLKNKTEQEAIDEIINGDKPDGYDGFALYLDEPVFKNIS